MLDLGFIPDIERICKLVPFTRQTLFFTATMPPEIRHITEQFLHNPVKVEVAKPASTVSSITQRLVKSGRESHEKRDTLRRLIRGADSFKNAIVFCNRKRDVAQLHRSLVRHGFNAAALHGDMDQSARTAALDSFRNGTVTLLVASDVAARGLDIPDVSHVFNFDVPVHADDYVHRIGRTGRAGKTGTAITIVGPADSKAITTIEKLIGQDIAWVADTAHADTDPAADRSEASDDHREPRRNGRGGGRHRHRTPRDEEQHHRPPDQRQPAAARQGQNGHTAPASHRAPVTRIDEARRRPAPPPPRLHEPLEQSGGHLPAFLLRPVRSKA
jgi:superfamily II DNA/RNA helicase